MSEPVDKGTLLDLERLFDDRAELREMVKYNADMYRRDVQFALDLMEDVQAGRITIVRARDDLRTAYQDGRDELRRLEDREGEG